MALAISHLPPLSSSTPKDNTTTTSRSFDDTKVLSADVPVAHDINTLRCLRSDLDSLRATVEHQGGTCTKIIRDVAQFQRALERSGLELGNRFDELQGKLGAVDREQGSMLKSLQEWKVSADTQLSVVSQELHQIGATMRGDLRRTSAEVDSKLAQPVKRFNADMNNLEARVKGEVRSVAEKQDGHASEVRILLSNIETQIRQNRERCDDVQKNCLQHTNMCKNALQKELEERCAALNQLLVVQGAEAKRLQTEALEAAMVHADNLHSALSVRLDEMSALIGRHHEEVLVRIAHAETTARERAAVSTEQALQRVDDHLQGMVTHASAALIDRVAATAEDLAKLQEFQKNDLESGFFSFVAREAVDNDLRKTIDRATTRLQAISNDLSNRTTVINDQITHVEHRMQECLATTSKQTAEIEERLRTALQQSPTS